MKKRDDKVIELLKNFNIYFNILDLGASGYEFPPFKRTKEISNMILVDPDSREFKVSNLSIKNEIRINKAIIDSEIDDQALLFLTKNPYCSSTLEPDFTKLTNFIYPDLFEVIDKKKLPATSLNRVSANYNIASFDWIKLDTQGTELRILKSLSPQLFSKLLFIDVEISFYAHYKGADTFSELHAFLEERNFWISEIDFQSRIRMQKNHYDKTLDLYSNKLYKKLIEHGLNICPTSSEMRYVRALNKIKEGTSFDYCLKLWSLNYFTNNLTYCLHIAYLTHDHFKNEHSEKMLNISLECLNTKPRLLRKFIRHYLFKFLSKI